MPYEVVVGPKLASARAGKIISIVTFNNSSDLDGAALHIKLLLPDKVETDAKYIERAANAASALAGQMCQDIAKGDIRGRDQAEVSPPIIDM